MKYRRVAKFKHILRSLQEVQANEGPEHDSALGGMGHYGTRHFFGPHAERKAARDRDRIMD
jgi:hypothetical protein